MAVGLPLKTTYANGDVYSASDVNDTNGTINVTAAPYAAGKNKIINGDFRFNQRNWTSSTASGTYGYDRWKQINSDGTVTMSAQAFTPGTAPVAGYEASNFMRIVTSGQTSVNAFAFPLQGIEDVRTLAGQTITISFWAKTTSGTPKVAVEMENSYGTGGSPSSNVQTYFGQVTLSTSWARYSVTGTMPTLTGKTLGTTANTSATFLGLWVSGGSTFNSRTGSLGIQNNTFDFWGVQVEYGSTATPFQTATGTIQGELAACQRYYWRNTSPGLANTRHTAIDYSALVAYDNVGIGNTITPTIDANANSFYTTVTATSTGLTQYRSYCILGNSGTSSLGLSAEL